MTNRSHTKSGSRSHHTKSRPGLQNHGHGFAAAGCTGSETGSDGTACYEGMPMTANRHITSNSEMLSLVPPTTCWARYQHCAAHSEVIDCEANGRTCVLRSRPILTAGRSTAMAASLTAKMRRNWIAKANSTSFPTNFCRAGPESNLESNLVRSWSVADFSPGFLQS